MSLKIANVLNRILKMTLQYLKAVDLNQMVLYIAEYLFENLA